MSIKFSERSTEKEILDDFNLASNDLVQNLKELERVNSLLGGKRIVVNGVKKIISDKNIKPLEKVNILDVGCGGGDNLRDLMTEFEKSEYRLSGLGIDANAEAIKYAKDNSQNFPELNFRQQNVENLEWGQFDHKIVMFNLFLHHFNEKEIVGILKNASANTEAILINDLQRSKPAYHLFRIFSRAFKFSDIGRHDGKLSIRKGFKEKEWHSLLKQAGMDNYQIRKHWAFRHQIIIYP